MLHDHVNGYLESFVRILTSDVSEMVSQGVQFYTTTQFCPGFLYLVYLNENIFFSSLMPEVSYFSTISYQPKEKLFQKIIVVAKYV